MSITPVKGTGLHIVELEHICRFKGPKHAHFVEMKWGGKRSIECVGRCEAKDHMSLPMGGKPSRKHPYEGNIFLYPSISPDFFSVSQIIHGICQALQVIDILRLLIRVMYSMTHKSSVVLSSSTLPSVNGQLSRKVQIQQQSLR